MMMTTYYRPPPLFPDHFKVTPVNRGEWEVGRSLLFTRSNIHDFEMGWRGGQWESYLLRERQAVKEGDGEDHQIGAHFSNLHIPTATFNTDRTNLCVLKSWNPLHFQTLPKWNMFSRHIFILQTTKQTHVWLLIKCLKMGKLLQPWQFHASSPTEAGIQVPFADSGFSGLAQRIIQIYLAAGFGDKSSTFYQTLGANIGTDFRSFFTFPDPRKRLPLTRLSRRSRCCKWCTYCKWNEYYSIYIIYNIYVISNCLGCFDH